MENKRVKINHHPEEKYVGATGCILKTIQSDKGVNLHKVMVGKEVLDNYATDCCVEVIDNKDTRDLVAVMFDYGDIEIYANYSLEEAIVDYAKMTQMSITDIVDGAEITVLSDEQLKNMAFYPDKACDDQSETNCYEAFKEMKEPGVFAINGGSW